MDNETRAIIIKQQMDEVEVAEIAVKLQRLKMEGK